MSWSALGGTQHWPAPPEPREPLPVPGERDIEAPWTLRFVLSRTRASAEQIAAWQAGSGLQWPDPIEAPVEVWAGPRRIAEGTLVVQAGKFAVRITALNSGS